MAKKKALVKSALLSKAKAVKLKYTNLDELLLEVYKELEQISNKSTAFKFISNALECTLLLESKNKSVTKALKDIDFDETTSTFYSTKFTKLCKESNLKVLNVDDFCFDIRNETLFVTLLYELIKGFITYKQVLIINDCFVDNIKVANLYENLLAKADEQTSKDTGVVYTPKEIAQFMCLDTLALYLYKALRGSVEIQVLKGLLLNDEKTIISFFEATSVDTRLKMFNSLLNVKILEPSMGVGVVYFEMYKTLYETAIKLALYDNIEFEDDELKKEIMSNMYGLDISKDALTLASCLKGVLLGHNLSVDTRFFNVETSLMDIKGLKSLIGVSEEFEFDIVIGNPPYVKSDRISDLDKSIISNYECHSPNADLLCYFFEQGCKLLKEGGILCYITSNKWLGASYGVGLRQFIINNFKVNSLYDFKNTRFFESADVETCITLAVKEKTNTAYELMYI